MLRGASVPGVAVRPEAEDGGCTLPLPQPARAAAAELAAGRPKPGMSNGVPHPQAEPCLDPVYRKQDESAGV